MERDSVTERKMKNSGKEQGQKKNGKSKSSVTGKGKRPPPRTWERERDLRDAGHAAETAMLGRARLPIFVLRCGGARWGREIFW